MPVQCSRKRLENEEQDMHSAPSAWKRIASERNTGQTGDKN